MRHLKIEKQVTTRETLSLNKYLQEISKYKLVTAEEEVELAKKIRKDDQYALEQLIRANLRFVVSVAKQYQNQGIMLTDLINEGNLGLIKAAQRFDETRGFKFISYAVWWIRQSIIKAVSEKSRTIRLPLNKIGMINKINKAFDILEQKFQREPTAYEVASTINISSEFVEDILKSKMHYLSMDAPLHASDEGNLYDVLINEDALSPEKYFLKTSLSIEIERALSTLDEKEAGIIRYYFGLSGHPQHSFDDLSVKYDISEERVRQIKEKALKKLKDNHRNILLKGYL